MRGMNRLPALPDCCSPLRADWPLPQTLPGSVWLCTDFTPATLAVEDFARCGIDMPASIQRSVAKRQAEFLAGRICARAALLQLDGTLATPGIGEDRAPLWPAHISGSITHSNGRAAALVALKRDWRSVGIDLENLLSPERALRLAKEILTPDECLRMSNGQIQSVAQGDSGRRLTRYQLSLDALPFKHQADDLRHRLVLENTLVGTVLQVGQLRHQAHLIAGQAPPRVTMRNALDLPVNAMAQRIEGEKGLAVQQGVEVMLACSLTNSIVKA